MSANKLPWILFTLNQRSYKHVYFSFLKNSTTDAVQISRIVIFKQSILANAGALIN